MPSSKQPQPCGKAAFHVPVLLEKCLEFLALKSKGKYVDGTLGMGGHSIALLESCSDIELLSVDRDAESIQHAQERIGRERKNFHTFHGNFSQIPQFISKLHWGGVNGILLDLGISSYQLAEAQRGFSFSKKGPLDMRMDQKKFLSASQWLSQVSEENLAEVLTEAGGVPRGKEVAKAILDRHHRQAFLDTQDLANFLKTVRGTIRRGGKFRHPATQVFQALRISVNQEFSSLERALEELPKCLCPKGRLVILSYHSGEDRRVKQAFKKMAGKGKELRDWKNLTKKAIKAPWKEICSNPRARSVRLRALERIG